MMQTLTKTELAWIYHALEKEVAEHNRTIQQAEKDNNALVGHIVTCKRDGLLETMHKINTALTNGSKQIKIG